MDESEAIEQEVDDGPDAATPIFNVYRRGYDPEQVDRYVNEQQRRLDEGLHRASEAERKLAAAVGQLRELHRRVATYESEARTTQPPALDSLGERVQRILQEAWEGAYNLRQEAERDVNEMRSVAQTEADKLREQANKDVEELRDVASREAAEVVDEATRRALHIRDEMDRRRHAYLERVERDRERSISQITYLYDQRQMALAELARLQTTVQATIEEMVRSPLGRPSAAISDAAAARQVPSIPDHEPEIAEPENDDVPPPIAASDVVDEVVVPDAMTDVEAPELVAEPPLVADRAPRTKFGDIVEDRGAEDPVGEWREVTHDDETLFGASSVVEPVRGPEPEFESRSYDLPTGPMESVGYGHMRQAPAEPTEAMPSPQASAAPSASGDPGDTAHGDAEQAEQAEETEVVRQPKHGGVYDAEAEGWA